MKRQLTASSVTEVEFGVTTKLPTEEMDVEEQTEFSPSPEQSTLPERREMQPLTLVMIMLAWALLFLIPSLLLMQRLQP
jgi:hypothetical protein